MATPGRGEVSYAIRVFQGGIKTPLNHPIHMDIFTLTTVNEFKSPSLALIRVRESGFQGHSPKSEITLNQVK